MRLRQNSAPMWLTAQSQQITAAHCNYVKFLEFSRKLKTDCLSVQNLHSWKDILKTLAVVLFCKVSSFRFVYFRDMLTLMRLMRLATILLTYKKLSFFKSHWRMKSIRFRNIFLIFSLFSKQHFPVFSRVKFFSQGIFYTMFLRILFHIKSPWFMK